MVGFALLRVFGAPTSAWLWSIRAFLHHAIRVPVPAPQCAFHTPRFDPDAAVPDRPAAVPTPPAPPGLCAAYPPAHSFGHTAPVPKRVWQIEPARVPPFPAGSALVSKPMLRPAARDPASHPARRPSPKEATPAERARLIGPDA